MAKDEKDETLLPLLPYKLTKGSHSRVESTEDGRLERKFYSTGNVILLTEAQAQGTFAGRVEGPLRDSEAKRVSQTSEPVTRVERGERTERAGQVTTDQTDRTDESTQFPWLEDSSATEVIRRMEGMNMAELESLYTAEEKGKNRKGVLNAAKNRYDELEEAARKSKG